MVEEEQVIWAYRLLLGREPESAAAVDQKLRSKNLRVLVNELLLSREFQARHPVIGTVFDKWVLTEHPLGFRIWVNLADLAVSWNVIREGYEKAQVKFVQQYVKRGDFAIDIGTNIGFYSLLFSRIVGSEGSVIGFEPLIHLFDAAKKSVEENGFSQCALHNVALADKRGSARIRYRRDSTNWGGASLCFEDSDPAGRIEVTVPIAPLADFVGDLKANFLKIDVEGAEYLVLSSARDYLSSMKPIVMSEIHREQLRRVSGTDPLAYIRMMNDIGYSCREIDGEGRPGRELTGREDLELVNVAFLPE